MTVDPQDFINACKNYLEATWAAIIAKEIDIPLPDLDPQLTTAIRASLSSTVKTYHYVLPTQLLAKAVNPDLAVHSLQAAYNHPRAFDARTLAHQVIVPFDQANYRVLGGSPEPYVNNPLRIPAVTEEYRSQQKAKTDWDHLITVLNAVETANNPEFTQLVFRQVLYEVYELLKNVQVTYPTPNRISLKQIQQLRDTYLQSNSGGLRMEAVSVAFFKTIGERFQLFDDVHYSTVNAADASSGMLADIECRHQGRVVLLVEVKERSLTLVQLDTKIDTARAEHIAELLFIAQGGIEGSEKTTVEERIATEFSSGQNVYVANFVDFALGILILLGEQGRVQFLDRIGNILDQMNANIQQRRTWSNLLRSI